VKSVRHTLSSHLPGDMRVALANPLREAYSETFIALQIKQLSPILRIHGYPTPNETLPGGPIRHARFFARLLAYSQALLSHGRSSVSLFHLELARRLRGQTVDVVLANFGYMAADVLPACIRASVPLVAHFHGLDAHRSDVLENYAERYYELAKRCSAAIVVSLEMKAALLSMGFPEGSISVVRYGVDPDLFGRRRVPSPDPRFLAVGRFVDKKAPYLTLCAFKEVAKLYPTSTMIFVGEGELLEATANLVEYFGLSHNVEIRGRQTPEKIADELSRSTAFVQHSLSPRMGPARGDKEGTPVSVLEAMMAGCPVVSVRHAGIGEVIEPGRDGLLVEERDVSGMAAAMISLIRNPGLGCLLGSKAAEKARAEYSSTHYISSLKNILSRAIARL
jgi:colanic acid/amylovoran biosynthesis glycosyltransferase